MRRPKWLTAIFLTAEQRERAVLDELSSRELSAADLSKATGILAGSLYPALLRLERDGLIEARWDDGRRLYRLCDLSF